MDYFSNPRNISVLKNYIMKDPLSDWFNIKHYSDGEYLKDNTSHYKEYIVDAADTYKRQLIHTIKELSELSIPENTSILETEEMIKNNDPLILKGKLINDGMIVDCDIIIRLDYFITIFKNIVNLPFHILCNPGDYLLITISYASVHFKLDLKETISDGILMYKKCCLYSFQLAMNKLLNYNPQCFILGKEYYYKNTLLPKKEFIGYLKIDSGIRNKYSNAIQWINKLIKNYNTMVVIPKPSDIELYPNMNYKESDWEIEKYKLATQLKEITLVWNISYEERCGYFEKGIYCWDDNKLLSCLKESKKKNIQERMIHMNKHDDILIYPRKTISSNLSNILQRKNDIYFDVESFLSFNEKQSLFGNDIIDEGPIIAIIGIIHNDNYYDFTIENYNIQSELKIVELFSKKLFEISDNNKLNIFHWGHAENNYMKYIYNKYPSIEFPEIELINILDYFRTEPIIVQGVFKFGLKSIGHALYKNKLINTTWGETDNGLDSMIQFKKYCIEKGSKKIPIKRYKEIKEIVEYNRIDCQVLLDIVNLLKKIYS